MLTGEAKTNYQREYMRKRRAATKAAQLVRPDDKSVRPCIPKAELQLDPPVVQSLDPKPVDIIASLKAKMDAIIERKETPAIIPALPPLHNPRIHRAGDLVRMWDGNKLVECIVPDTDADGNVMYEGGY